MVSDSGALEQPITFERMRDCRFDRVDSASDRRPADEPGALPGPAASPDRFRYVIHLDDELPPAYVAEAIRMLHERTGPFAHLASGAGFTRVDLSWLVQRGDNSPSVRCVGPPGKIGCSVWPFGEPVMWSGWAAGLLSFQERMDD